MRNFLVAAEELGLPTFEASDLEQVNSKVLNHDNENVKNSIYNMLTLEFGNDSIITIGNGLMNQSGLI